MEYLLESHNLIMATENATRRRVSGSPSSMVRTASNTLENAPVVTRASTSPMLDQIDMAALVSDTRGKIETDTQNNSFTIVMD
jgi:hypothetical protein